MYALRSSNIALYWCCVSCVEGLRNLPACFKICPMFEKLTREKWEDWARENRIKYFKFEEFVKERGGFIDAELVLKMERLREYCGFPLIITSGYRSPERNREVGGASNSYHLRGEAVDVSIRGFSPSMLYRFLRGAFLVGFGGIIVYPSHVHLDMRQVEYFAVAGYNKNSKT
jgi:hypothetical protein